MDENLLNDAEKQAVEAFSKKIDLTDSNLILQPARRPAER